MASSYKGMKNYYEILQVNENASIEIIEKAYKVLAKKYHPDLQKDANKKKMLEQKLQQINEAYDVLSNEFLKEQYDMEFRREKEEKLKNQYGTKDYGTERKNFYSNQNNTSTMQQDVNITNQEQKKQYNSHLGTMAGIVDLVKVLYNDRPKREEIKEITKKDFIALGLTIIVLVISCIILWCIPFTRSWINELLFENPVFRWIGQLFK